MHSSAQLIILLAIPRNMETFSIIINRTHGTCSDGVIKLELFMTHGNKMCLFFSFDFFEKCVNIFLLILKMLTYPITTNNCTEIDRQNPWCCKHFSTEMIHFFIFNNHPLDFIYTGKTVCITLEFIRSCFARNVT